MDLLSAEMLDRLTNSLAVIVAFGMRMVKGGVS